MMDPKHLIWLAEIAELGSLSRAAQKLHVAQPTLTRAVQIVEDQVGSRVFERERHGVRPTIIGERLIDVGRSILEERARAEDVVDLWREGLNRELRVGVGTMLAASIMGRFFAGLLSDRPRFAFRVMTSTVSSLIRRLNEGDLDVVLAPEQINLFQDDLTQFKLCEDQLAIFSGAQNPLQKKSGPITPDDLENRTWINVGALSGLLGANKEVLRQLGIRHVSSAINFTGDVIMAAEILRSSESFSVLPLRLTSHAPAFHDTGPIECSFQLPRRDIVLWARRPEADRPDITWFRDRLVSFFDASFAEPKD